MPEFTMEEHDQNVFDRGVRCSECNASAQFASIQEMYSAGWRGGAYGPMCATCVANPHRPPTKHEANKREFVKSALDMCLLGSSLIFNARATLYRLTSDGFGYYSVYELRAETTNPATFVDLVLRFRGYGPETATYLLELLQ